MAEKFRFFDAVEDENGVSDREYNAQEFTDYFKALVTTGLMKGAGNELKVTTNGSSMIMSIDTGIAFILGRYYENDSPIELTHDTETVGNNRIDRIVIRMDLSTDARYVKAFIKKGVPSTNPIAPNLTQTANLYEISLAQIKIVGGQTYIAVHDVRDERGTNVICPWAGSNILPNFSDSSLGLPNGIATLDESGNVPMEQLQNVPLPQDASTKQKGIVQLNNTLTSTSITEAATANTVRQAYDRGNSAYNLLVGASIAVGARALANGTFGVAVGTDNNARGQYGIAIGYSNIANFNNDISIGQSATARGGTSIAIGNKAISGANYDGGGAAIAIGYEALANGVNAIAIGASSKANAHYSTAIGLYANALNERDLVLGNSSDNTRIAGNLFVTKTKNFEMPHPNPAKKGTHVIRHGAVESPTTGDTLYRYAIEAMSDGETVEMQLPDYFEHLNTNVDVWVGPHLHFGRAFGIVEGDILKVTCEKAGVYKALVIGTRNDDGVQEWYIKGVEREIGETWENETALFEVDELTEINEFGEDLQ